MRLRYFIVEITLFFQTLLVQVDKIAVPGQEGGRSVG